MFLFYKVPHLVQFFEDMQGTGVDALSAEERVELEKLRGEYERLKVKLSGSAASKISVEKVANKASKSDASSSSDSEVRYFRLKSLPFFVVYNQSHTSLSILFWLSTGRRLGQFTLARFRRDEAAIAEDENFCVSRGVWQIQQERGLLGKSSPQIRKYQAKVSISTPNFLCMLSQPFFYSLCVCNLGSKNVYCPLLCLSRWMKPV